ncbi:MAG: tetratricopeptide repeat protein [Steroidobacteraceae bacterium]
MKSTDAASESGRSAQIARAKFLHRSGDLVGAVGLYRVLVAHSPDDPTVLSLLGVALLQHGGTAEGVALLERSLEANPDQPQNLYNAAVGLCALRRFDEAILRLNRAQALAADSPRIPCQIAIALRGLGRPRDALPYLEYAIRLDSQFPEAFSERGRVHLDLAMPDSALCDFAQVIDLDPHNADAHYHLGLAAHGCQRFEEADAGYTRALQLNPRLAAAYNNRGRARRALNRPEAAVRDYECAIELDSQFAEAHNNLGVALKVMRRFDESLKSYERAATLNPDFADVSWNIALLHLLQGNFESGWPLYESRWALKPPRPFTQPLWLGEQPLEGRTLLIHSEQGLGDMIQFCRFIPLLVQRCSRLIVEAPHVLIPLLSTLQSQFQLLERGKALPAFDLHCPVMSLPLAFKTRLGSIPSQTPYLYADAGKSAAVHRALGAKLRPRIGVVWSGSSNHDDDRNRSIGPALLEAISDLPLELHSLQKEYHESDRAFLVGAHACIRDHSRELEDFSDTAALVSAMDVVVSVDTAVAHLCGAMAKPVWILLPYSPDFRWLLDRSDSPWYPTATLIRQSAPGDWSVVLRTVRQMLTSFAGATHR